MLIHFCDCLLVLWHKDVHTICSERSCGVICATNVISPKFCGTGTSTGCSSVRSGTCVCLCVVVCQRLCASLFVVCVLCVGGGRRGEWWWWRRSLRCKGNLLLLFQVPHWSKTHSERCQYSQVFSLTHFACLNLKQSGLSGVPEGLVPVRLPSLSMDFRRDEGEGHPRPFQSPSRLLDHV